MTRLRVTRALAVGGTVLAIVAIMPVPKALATTYAPTRFDDPGPPFSCDPADCSLREAVIAANASPGPDTISLQAGTYTLGLPGTGEGASLNGDLDLTEGTTTIIGAGSGSTVIDGGNPATGERVIDIDDTGAASISNVTIRNGQDSGLSGGGIRVNGPGSLILEDSAVTANSSGGFGGGIRVFSPAATTTLTNVTVSGNSASGGGGIAISGITAVTTLNNVTITGNTADPDQDGTGDGGGILVFSGSPMLRNSIVAGNTDASPLPADRDPECSGSITSQGHNLIGDATNCAFAATTGDQVGTAAALIDPKIGLLTDNGGPTQTHALLPGSQAIDAGDPASPGSGGTACAAADQRGVPRPGACDVGAYELMLCKGVIVNRVGTSGNDVLTGTGGPDGFLAQGGNDTVKGLGGSDAACLGDGNDKGSGGGGKDKLLGEKGKDKLKGQGGKDLLVCGPGKDTGTGGPGRDRLKKCEKGKP